MGQTSDMTVCSRDVCYARRCALRPRVDEIFGRYFSGCIDRAISEKPGWLLSRKKNPG
jgi:hypothetical protein